MPTAKTQSLQRAFAAFNDRAGELERAYLELQQMVSRLHAELHCARQERERAAEENQRLNGTLGGLLNSLPGGVIVLREDGIVAQCNETAVNMLGEPLLGQPWQEVIQRMRMSDLDGDLELADGRRVGIARRELDAHQGHIILLSDVTESRRLQGLLARDERLTELGEVCAKLAHQIRTPLSCAMLYGSQLGGGDLPEAKRTKYADKLNTRLQQLARMVDDMLAYVRGGRLYEGRFDPAGLLGEVAQVVEPQLGQGDQVSVGDCGNLQWMRGNRDALLGALSNLVSNALQAGGGKTHVRLSARRGTSGEVVLSVRDDGPGIPRSLHERIFEPFYTTRPDGNGLGLAVVRSAARAHGGDVAVSSATTGGACIEMRIPQRRSRDRALPAVTNRHARRGLAAL